MLRLCAAIFFGYAAYRVYLRLDSLKQIVESLQLETIISNFPMLKNNKWNKRDSSLDMDISKDGRTLTHSGPKEVNISARSALPISKLYPMPHKQKYIFGHFETKMLQSSYNPIIGFDGNVHQQQLNREESVVYVEKLQTPAEDNFRRKEQKAREMVYKYMAIYGAPGLSIGITKNGKPLWSEGFGFADVETGAPCTGESVMRIASISKAITAANAARLVERGKLDLDKSIHEYLSVDEFPKKMFNGKRVEITARQLLCHTSGVRHYSKENELAPSNSSEEPVEFMSNKRFNSVLDSLSMFKADPLLSEPGTKYHYTTHGYTLLSAVLEKASGGQEFRDQLRALFRRLDMRNTFLDDAQERIVLHRARFYKRNDITHRLENVREVDNSYKLAGGGILSNVGDLLKFGNAILYSYQYSNGPRPLLRPETVKKLWTKNSEDWANGKKLEEYGLGWCLADDPNEWDKEESDEKNEKGAALVDFDKRKYWFHIGGAVGTSSILLIKPEETIENSDNELPCGICVAILVNCEYCSCKMLAIELAALFGDE